MCGQKEGKDRNSKSYDPTRTGWIYPRTHHIDKCRVLTKEGVEREWVEGVDELKRIVMIKGEKNETLLTNLGQ